MTTLLELANAHPVIGKRWSQGPSPEQARILVLARDALDFIFATGQRQRFEARLRPLDSDNTQPRDDLAELSELMGRTSRFFEQLRDAPESADEPAQCQAILDALRFIASTGQHGAFAAYREHAEADAPPFVVASFDTPEEAEAWLARHPHPPDPANVLIVGAYHDVIHDRETNMRRLPRNRALEWYLEELAEKEPPVAVASFETRDQAEAWLKSQAEPARRAWVSVGGKLHLAVYYPNIHHRVLFPLDRSRTRLRSRPDLEVVRGPVDE